METPLLAFLVPFSPDLWVTIFMSLNVTALAVAIYEWLSPFGLNPWGRQRTKNFSYGSALWVIWGLLFSHLVAFKAPKSWPNKVLINVWGAFSVIFVASYTANIAALFAGLFNRRDTHGRSLYSSRAGSIRFSASEFYISKKNPSLWAHIKSNLVDNFTEALDSLHSGRLEVLVGDAAILDHMRANDPGCTLQSAGPDLVDDTYAVAMPRGFPLRMRINAAISQYVASGHLEYLRHKWYGSGPCFRLTADIYKPQPLEFATVAGVFLMLILGIIIGIFILILEHVVYRYALPSLRTKPKGSIWRNRNLMFFSQKLYKFVNCYELVSPHHSAKELVNNLRTGQIMGLFQKSVKRKENEQRRRRKSKAQFFEMIQEIRRVQKAEKSLETLSPSMEILESNTAANRNILPEATSFTTSFTASVTSDAIPLPPPSTSSIHSPSSTTLRVGASSVKGGRSPPGITIDYIPGPNPEEDYEGILIVNRRRSSSHGGDCRKKKKRGRGDEGVDVEGGKGRSSSKSSLNNNSTSLHHQSSSSPSRRKKDDVEAADSAGTEDITVTVETVEDEENEISSSKSSKEARRKKRHRRKLERSPRIESSAEDASNGVGVSVVSLEAPTGGQSLNGDADDDETVAAKGGAFRPSVSPMPSALSAPASLFGEDSSCDCERLHETSVSGATQPLLNLPSPQSHWGLRPYVAQKSSSRATEDHFKSKSLDEAQIQPPSDFMSPAGTSETRTFTSMSFPCSPHVFESPSSGRGPHLHHFLSEGDERWGEIERHQRFFGGRPGEPTDCAILSPSGYHSSAPYHHYIPNSSKAHYRQYGSEPAHLRNMTKGDLWRMWQDTELELRQRLCQVEEERNILASHLSHKYKGSTNEQIPYDGTAAFRRRDIEEGSITPDAEPSGCLDVELEVPFEFRDSTSKDFQRRCRYSRSLDEEHSYRASSTVGSQGGPFVDYTRCDDLGCRSAMEKEYDDFFRSVRSLEDSLLADNEHKSEIPRRLHHQRASKSKPSRRRRDSTNPRRCKSSLDSRRSRSLAKESASGSSESPKVERMSVSSFDTRGTGTSQSSRGRSRRKKSSPLPLGDVSDKSTVSRDYRRRKSKASRSDKLPFLSLPRNKPQQRRKYSSTLSYCSRSSSTDQEEELPFSRQYAEPSPLPLLQSLQRHSLGKQQQSESSYNQKQKQRPVDPFTLDSRHGRKSLRRVSPYVEHPHYITGTDEYLDAHHLHQTSHRTPQENHGMHHSERLQQTGHRRRRSSLEIPDARSTAELY